MTTAQYPNKDALWKGLDIYQEQMGQFITYVLKQKPGSRLEQTIANSLTDQQRQHFADKLREYDGDVPRAIEIAFIPNLVERNWNDHLFQPRLDKPAIARNRFRSIRDTRNELAHDTGGQDLPPEKARARLYTIAEALQSINRPEPAAEVQAIPIHTPAAAPSPQSPSPAAAPEPPPRAGSGAALKPWRSVIRPKQDVAEGSFLEADFLADLQRVFNGTAPAMYGDPLEFFHCTYITHGIGDLLATALRRVNGKGGNPVIQTKTGFGGGKTHSLIALYHLFNSADELLQSGDPDTRREIARLMAAAGVDPQQRAAAKVCVLQGAWLSETGGLVTDAGDSRDTLWGEMAWQLGGQPAYETVGAAARQGTAPGGAELDRLFRLVGPCVILIDEIVNYARNADLDTIATFFQNLTEAVNRRDNVALIVTLPATATEAAGERGLDAMAVLENTLNRIQAVTQVTQTSNDEAFAVVRRRLFQEDCDDAARDATCQAFYRMYQRGANEYPQEARETRYQERLRQCYPIHPEIFDRLYDDWSLYHQFQRTRGVLRLLAQAITWLCAEDDQSPLIMPGNLPLSETSPVSAEFVRLLGPQWSAVLGEVDGDNSRAHAIDRQKPERFGSVGGAARRAARAVFLGSATQKAIRGLNPRQVNLGVVAPTHGAAVYAEAVQAMDGELYHFYRGNDNRYYFDSEENLNKVANDRAAELDHETLNHEITRRLREFNRRDPARAVIAGPQSPADVRDEDFVRLIILRPDQSKPSRAAETDHAAHAARQMLHHCAPDARRIRPNTLLFLAPSSDGVREMHRAARRYLAWDSIINGARRVAHLTGDRLRQSRDQQKEANAALDTALASAYRWIMAPSQPNPQSADYDTADWRQINAQSDLAANALRRFADDELLVDTLAPAALQRRLQESVWRGPNPRDHLTVDQLWDLLTGHIHLGLRLRNREVLDLCLTQGFQTGAFARADGYDADAGHYRNLTRRIGEPQRPYLTGATLLVEPELAQLLIDEAAAAAPAPGDTGPDPKPGATDPGRNDAIAPAPPTPPRPRRLTARKTVTQQEAAAYDFNTIRDEIARVMAAAGCHVTVEITITAQHHDGISENLARSLRDNSNMLGITLQDDLLIG